MKFIDPKPLLEDDQHVNHVIDRHFLIALSDLAGNKIPRLPRHSLSHSLSLIPRLYYIEGFLDLRVTVA